MQHKPPMKRPPWEDDSLAPNGQPVRQNFAEWFSKSHVVDILGAPLEVYHGAPDTRFATTGDQVFRTKQERRFGHDPARAFFFCASESVARTYADPRRLFDFQDAEEGIIPVYLSIQDPLLIDARSEHWRGTAGMIAQAREEGRDGAIIKNVRDTYNGRREQRVPITTVYVAFSPQQIKAARSNPGLYCSHSASINDHDVMQALLLKARALQAIEPGLAESPSP